MEITRDRWGAARLSEKLRSRKKFWRLNTTIKKIAGKNPCSRLIKVDEVSDRTFDVHPHLNPVQFVSPDNLKNPLMKHPNPTPAVNASRNPVTEVLEEALQLSLGTFPGASLHHLKDHQDDLMRGKYEEGGKGCIFNLLSRPLEIRIDSRPALSLWFTGDAGCSLREHSPLYLAARKVIEAWDNGSLEVEAVVAAVDRILAISEPEDASGRAPARLKLWQESKPPGIPVVPCFVQNATGAGFSAPVEKSAPSPFAAKALAPVQLEMFEESDCPF